MTISVSAALKTFFSPVINKTLLFTYLSIYALMVISYVIGYSSKNISYMMLGYTLYVIAMFILSGLQIMTINNLVQNKQSAIPSFSQLGKIFVNGLKLFVWSMFTVFILLFALSVVLFTFAFLFHKSAYFVLISVLVFLFLLAVMIFVTLAYFIPSYCYFAKTLKFVSLFDIPKISAFRKKRNFCYSAYILKFFGMAILFLFIIISLFIPIAVYAFMVNGIHGQMLSPEILLPLDFFYIIACAMFGFAVYVPMSAQYLSLIHI